jgi:hypothetical protein
MLAAAGSAFDAERRHGGKYPRRAHVRACDRPGHGLGLREGNPGHCQQVPVCADFVKGGALYKYGITDAVGNFAIRIDPFPIRYQVDSRTALLNRVFPTRTSRPPLASRAW